MVVLAPCHGKKELEPEPEVAMAMSQCRSVGDRVGAAPQLHSSILSAAAAPSSAPSFCSVN